MTDLTRAQWNLLSDQQKWDIYCLVESERDAAEGELALRQNADQKAYGTLVLSIQTKPLTDSEVDALRMQTSGD